MGILGVLFSLFGIKSFLIIQGLFNLGRAGPTTFQLSSGNDMPMVGFSTYGIKASDAEKLIKMAIDVGYRHFDVNWRNEEAAGKAIKKWVDEGGDRKDLFVTVKLPVYANRASDVEKSINSSLDRLGLTYADMFMIQAPFSFVPNNDSTGSAKNEDGTYVLDTDSDMLATWKEMENQVRAGKTKSIGLGIFNQTQVSSILDMAEIKPSMLKVEVHAQFQQKPLREFCTTNNIVVVAMAPLGSVHAREIFHPEQTKEDFPDLLQDPGIKEIGAKYNKSVVQVMLRHLTQGGVAVTVKGVREDVMKEELNVLDFDLTEDEMKTMDSYDKGDAGRIFDFKFLKGVEKHPQYPFAAN